MQIILKRQKGHTNVHTEYTNDRQKEKGKQKYSLPQSNPNQSMKSTKDIDE